MWLKNWRTYEIGIQTPVKAYRSELLKPPIIKEFPMYAKNKETIIDRREMLRVKLKSLAEEAKIIRCEERRSFGQIRDELHLHRVKDVRRAARMTHIAYALIKGRTMEQIEPNAGTEPDWDAVGKMIKKYGPRDFLMPGEFKKAA